MFRRLFWLSVVAGVGYMIWRWVRAQGEATAPAATSRIYTPPASPAPSPATITAAPQAAAPTAPATGRRTIPTRVHRGAPPPPPASTPAPEVAAPPATTDEPSPEVAAPPATTDEPAAQDSGTLASEEAPADLTALAGAATQASDDLAELVGDAVAGEGVVDLPPLESPETAGEPALTNLNTADEDALVALPGIGRALAKRIIAHRQEHGPFASIDDLEVIQGIGSRNIAEFRHLVTV